MSFPPAPGGRIGGISGDVELMLTLICIHSVYSVVLVSNSIFSRCASYTPRYSLRLHAHSHSHSYSPSYSQSAHSCSLYYCVRSITLHFGIYTDSLHVTPCIHPAPPPPTHGPAPVPCASMIGTDSAADQSGTWGRGVDRGDHFVLLRSCQAGKCLFRARPLPLRE